MTVPVKERLFENLVKKKRTVLEKNPEERLDHHTTTTTTTLEDMVVWPGQVYLSLSSLFKKSLDLRIGDPWGCKRREKVTHFGHVSVAFNILPVDLGEPHDHLASSFPFLDVRVWRILHRVSGLPFQAAPPPRPAAYLGAERSVYCNFV